MSFGISGATWLAVGALAASTAASLYSSNQAGAQQNKAIRESRKTALANQRASDEATNRANAKSPDVSAMMASAALASRSGQAGTLLTGPQGLDTSSLTLGRNALLGG